MKIRTKISLYLGPLVLLIICVLFIADYYVIRNALMENARAELVKTEKNMHRAAQSLLSTAINNYLRGITEKNIDFVEKQYQRYKLGELTIIEAKSLIQKHFDLQQVGDSGYLVAVEEKDNNLYLDLHPFLPKTECSTTEGCQEWAKTRNGYTEYNWKNPSDNSYRKKAAYVQEFPEWNWIVGASSYRDEFVKLVNVEDLSKFISPIRINKSGYFFVYDENLKVLIHPEYKNVDGNEMINSRGENILKLLHHNKGGYLEYLWKNPSEKKERLKYAFSEKLEGYNWYLVASGYVSEIYDPIEKFKKITLFMVVLITVILLFMITRLSKIISTPLWHLRTAIENFYKDKEEMSWAPHHIEEINTLGKAFSQMTSELHSSMDELKEKNRELAASQKSKEQSKLYLESILNSMSSIIIGIDRDMLITQWNIEAENHTGYFLRDVNNKPLFTIIDWLEPHKAAIARCLKENTSLSLSQKTTSDSGPDIYYEIKLYPLAPAGNQGAVIRIDNVSDRVSMEERLRQSQKMDAVGQLAGGIAHDFNNMLSGILGSAELLKAKVQPKEKKLVQIISDSSYRAGELIQKLLAFSRKENIAFVSLNLHDIIKDTSIILGRTLDKKISIDSNLNAESPLIRGDLSQLQAALLNIGINSGHAMPDGGVLSFTTTNITLEKDFSHNNQELPSGHYLQLQIRDTGLGIPPGNLKHIFEPFFTTKDQDKGTGLGLAAVYGTVKQHKGAITVDSEVGEGTSFTIFLPISGPEEASDIVIDNTDEQIITGQGCILIIDDESVVRSIAKMILEKLGYVTLEADNGEKGLEIYREQQEKIDLVLLDMLMPVMDGTECFYALKKINPNVQVVVCSGFTRDADLTSLKKSGLAGLVRKPYNIVELSKVVASGTKIS